MKSALLSLVVLVGGATTALAQAGAVRMKLDIPSNVEVRAYAPDSALFAVSDAAPIARGDTVVLRDGDVLSFDETSGPLRFLVRGMEKGQTVTISGTGERKQRWAAFVSHDVSINARGQFMPFVSSTAPNRVADRDPK